MTAASTVDAISHSPFPSEVDLATLGQRTLIGSGGQGAVHALAQRPGVVYKEYSPAWVDSVNVTALKRFTRLVSDVTDPEVKALLAVAAWPMAVVRDSGVVRGFLMPQVPRAYTARLELPSGPSTVLAQVQYLLNDEDYLAARGFVVHDRLRLELLRDTAAALAMLHRRGIAVGDISPNNLLFSTVSRPRCYFIDCDTMRLDGHCVLPLAETPEWDVPALPGADRPTRGDLLATPESDAYKLGLLAIRLFAGDQQVRDPAAATHLPASVLQLARRSLDADPARRVPPERWVPALDAALAGGGTQLVVVRSDRAGNLARHRAVTEAVAVAAGG